MSKLNSNLISYNSSKMNITSIINKSKKKKVKNQEILLLKKLVNSEVREAKGQSLINSYIKSVEREYESLIEKAINDDILNETNKKSLIFQKALNKVQSKINSKDKSKKNILNNSNSSSFYDNKLVKSNSSLNITPIKKSSKKNKIEQNKENSNQQSIYWKDYEFLKMSSAEPIKKAKKVINKNIIRNKSKEKLNKSNTSSVKEKQLEDYYIYLLNRRKKICDDKKLNEAELQEKIESEILRKLFEQIFNEDDKLKKYLEDEKSPDFYKRFIIQNEIKKDNILSKIFKLNFKESSNLEGPKLCDKSRFICKYIINYEPIYKRLDEIIKLRKINLEKIKKRLLKHKYKKHSEKKYDIIKNKEWLKSMDNWYARKKYKIKEIKEQIEKNNPINKECKFQPSISHNKNNDDNIDIKNNKVGILCSDRLYSEYFILKEKKEKLIEKQKNNFSFHPNISYMEEMLI